MVDGPVAGIAAAGGLNAMTATGAAEIEAEDNQLAQLFQASPPPSWMADLIELPGYKGETATKATVSLLTRHLSLIRQLRRVNSSHWQTIRV